MCPFLHKFPRLICKYDLTRLPEFFPNFFFDMIFTFNDKGWSADSAAWFVPRLNRTFLPFIRKIHPVRGEKIHTTATSYRHATWPRFQWNNLICAYIYIPQWWSWCIGFVQAWIAANCTTDQCNRSQPCENGNFTRISLLRLTYLHIAPYVA